MPPPFSLLTNDEFSEMLLRFPFSRHVNIVHVHHTWRPNHAQYRGHASIEGMWRHHTQVNGWRDIAQHVSIGPEGAIWLGRNWNLPPASAAGHNGTGDFGPFMIETIGDFDVGQDDLEDPQRAALVHVIAAVQERFALPHMAVMFHNAMSRKTCPGSAIDFEALVAEVEMARPSAITAEGIAVLPEAQRKRIDEEIARFTREVPAPRGDESLAEHEPHDEFTLQRSERGGFEVLPGLTREMIDALRPHVINLRGGQFSTDGQMTTVPADVDTLMDTHLPRALQQAEAQARPLRIVLYAHGGLVSESSGLGRAHRHLAWWKANNIYPINFVWETGLWEIIFDLLRKVVGLSLIHI